VPCAGGASELALLFAFYLGTIVLTVTSDRARLPLLVPLAPFAGFFAVQVVAWIRARARAELGFAAGCLGIAALLAHMPSLPAADRAEDWDERDYNLAVQWFDVADREEEGRRIADELLAKHPTTARIVLLDVSYDARRALRRAREAWDDPRPELPDGLRRAISIADDERVFPRERFRANAIAAWIAFELDDCAESVRRYALARAFDDESPELLEGQARARLGLAEAHLDAAQPLLQQSGSPREQGERLVEEALDLLQSVAMDRAAPRLQRSLARLRAGWIQVGLGRLPSAERHFRAARELADSREAREGLIRVLVDRAKALSPGPERDACVDEARRLVEPLSPIDREAGGFDRLLQDLGPH
jgi:hypothetical protein